MTAETERRKAARDPDDELSPELVAVLLMCGGEVRETDREALEVGRHPGLADRRRPERRRHEAA